MANEYGTLALLKSMLGINDTTEDTLLTQNHASASRAVDSHCGRRFYADAAPTAREYRIADRLVCGLDGDLLIVDDISSLTGLVVETGDGTTWTTITDYKTEPDNALVQGKPVTYLRRPYYSWQTSSRARVRVTAKWGWPAIPDEVVQATLIQAARLFKRKDTPQGVAGSAEWGFIRMSRVDPDVQALLQPFVIQAIG